PGAGQGPPAAQAIRTRLGGRGRSAASEPPVGRRLDGARDRTGGNGRLLASAGRRGTTSAARAARCAGVADAWQSPCPAGGTGVSTGRFYRFSPATTGNRARPARPR